MKKAIIIIFSLVVLLTTTGLQADHPQHKRYIVKLKEFPLKAKMKKRAAFIAKGQILKELHKGFVINLEEGHTPEELLQDQDVAAVEEDKVVTLIEPVSREFVDISILSEEVPPGIKRINAKMCGEVDATVAIIDTGIDMDHYDLNVVGGYNFMNPSIAPYDDNGHGTHVAGTVGAKCNNKGVLGVAPGVKLLALKVLGSDGSGYLSDIIAAIDWVTEHADTIDVVNMSLGMTGKSDLLHDAIKRSVDKGVIYSVAAGNSASDIFGDTLNFSNGWNFIPAAYPEVMTISAMVATDGSSGGKGPRSTFGNDDTIATFSNFSSVDHTDNPVYSLGAGIDLAAPGVDIISTAPGGKLARMSGTSMASPHAAGAAARLIWQHGRDFNGDGIRDAADVYAIRQALIDMAEPQEDWNPQHDARDPDPNHEGLLHLN